MTRTDAYILAMENAIEAIYRQAGGGEPNVISQYQIGRILHQFGLDLPYDFSADPGPTCRASTTTAQLAAAGQDCSSAAEAQPKPHQAD